MVSDPDNKALVLEKSAGWLSGNVLDLRAARDFFGCHLRGAAGHPLAGLESTADPQAFLAQNLPSIYLPPRHESLLVICAPGIAPRAIREHLEGRGRTQITVLALSEKDMAALPARMLAAGRSDRHLWSAPPWLVAHADLLPPPAAGPVLDLACGSGRAVVWMAERGYRATGLDWQVEALAFGRQLAANRGVRGRFAAVDLRSPASVPPGPWAAVLNFRYLQRDLLERMPALLRPGGVAMVRTFRDAPGYEGHPRPRHRLARGELLQYFATGVFEILAHEEGHDPDGRPAAGIVARKKTS